MSISEAMMTAESTRTDDVVETGLHKPVAGMDNARLLLGEKPSDEASKIGGRSAFVKPDTENAEPDATLKGGDAKERPVMFEVLLMLRKIFGKNDADTPEK